jgi:hypothetical protein
LRPNPRNYIALEVLGLVPKIITEFLQAESELPCNFLLHYSNINHSQP